MIIYNNNPPDDFKLVLFVDYHWLGADICSNYFADIYNISNDINIFHEFKSTIPFPKSSKINYTFPRKTLR